MNIKITKIDSLAEGKLFVDFESNYGSAKAIWYSSYGKPSINCFYYVEINIPDMFVWGKNIEVSNEKRFNICDGSDGIYITGVLESLNNEDIYYLRFGKDIIMIEGNFDKSEIGEYIVLKTNVLEVFDIGL